VCLCLCLGSIDLSMAYKHLLFAFLYHGNQEQVGKTKVDA